MENWPEAVKKETCRTHLAPSTRSAECRVRSAGKGACGMFHVKHSHGVGRAGARRQFLRGCAEKFAWGKCAESRVVWRSAVFRKVLWNCALQFLLARRGGRLSGAGGIFCAVSDQ